MKNLKLILAGTTLAFAFGAAAAPAPLKTGREKVDNAKANADLNRAKLDAAAAKKLFETAAKHDKNAVVLWKKAHDAWVVRHNAIKGAREQHMAAHYNRRLASALSAEANRMFRASFHRAAARDLLLRADESDKEANKAKATMGAAEGNVRSGENAMKDLGANPAFADAVKVIKADVEAQQKRIESNKKTMTEAVAKASRQRADAAKHEAEAAKIEKVPMFPVALPVIKLAPVKPLATPVDAKAAADKAAATAKAATQAPAQVAPEAPKAP